MSEFDAHYLKSKDQCPPQAAADPEGTYLRMVSAPPKESDLLSQYEEHKKGGCPERAVSFFDTPKGVQRLVAAYPERYKGKTIAKLEFRKGWGVMLKGGNHGGFRHVSLWLYKDAPRKSIADSFELLEG